MGARTHAIWQPYAGALSNQAFLAGVGTYGAAWLAV